MTLPGFQRWSAPLLAGILAGLLAGCGAGSQPDKTGKKKTATAAGPPDDLVAIIKFPPSRPPRMSLTPAEAALVYPPIDKVDRDPFLTAAEEDEYDGRPASPADVVAQETPTIHHRPKKLPSAKLIALLHKEVKEIIIGARNTFLFEGQLFEEGDVLPDKSTGKDSPWKVTSITEEGIHLKTVDGRQSDYLKFGIDAAPTFQIRRNNN